MLYLGNTNLEISHKIQKQMDVCLWMRLQHFMLSAGAAPGSSPLCADLQQVIMLMEAGYFQDLDYDKPLVIWMNCLGEKQDVSLQTGIYRSS